MKDLSRRFPVWLCDVWGVIHDGHRPFATAVHALEQHRKHGGKVILITNAPRPKAIIEKSLDRIGVPRSAFDNMVTSGDVTRTLMMAHGGGQVFHLGPEQDLTLFEGLPIKRVPIAEARACVCIGLRDEYHEKPEEYLPLLQEMKDHDLLMICANPDKVVRKGKDLLPCAGALADLYEGIGGKVLMAGKPFAPIYDLALERAGNPPRSLVLAIGDGPETDILGAIQNKLACVFISGGINAGPGAEDEVRMRYPQAEIVHSMRELYWT